MFLLAVCHVELVDGQHIFALLSRVGRISWPTGFVNAVLSTAREKLQVLQPRGTSGPNFFRAAFSAASLPLHSLHESPGLHHRFVARSNLQRARIAFLLSGSALSSCGVLHLPVATASFTPKRKTA
jgi:hypothetical protein